MRTPQTLNGRPQTGSDPTSGRLARALRDVSRNLPKGGALTDRVWNARHRRLRQLLVVHAVGIAIFGALRGFGVLHSAMEGSIVLLAAIGAGSPRLSRTVRAMVASVGLMAASAILVHISGGLIEFHFHFFVMVALISLYQEWAPFLAAIGFVVLHHGTVGVLDPEAVYNHSAAWANPWGWAMLHGGFILAMSVASMAAWRLNEFQALYDPLTKLPNRELFRDRVERALAASTRQRKAIAVLLFDLNGFKNVNDSLGHSAGDLLLAQVAERLRRCVRTMDVACRLGGDEFAVLIHDIHAAHDSVRVAERIERALREPFHIEGHELMVSASMGIGIADGLDAATTSAEQLLREADVAMYKAKDDPDAWYRVFDPVMHAAAVHRLETEADLRQALERGELVVHYQPIVGLLEPNDAVGVEALVRWNHSIKGMIPPLDFIPLAEETGLIVELGKYVLREACRDVLDWRIGKEQTLIRLNVNLSTRQLRDPVLVRDVASILEEIGFAPERLCLEITENATLENDPMVMEQLHRLRLLGVRIGIDDFGTGYASLSYLARLPVDLLKIDRSFVRALADGSPEGSLVGVICQLANDWGLVVVGEGIEEQPELEKLRGQGCVLGQGYYFGRPGPAEDIRRAIEAQRPEVPSPVG